MNVNITLLMMITLAARIRPWPRLGLVGPSVPDMGRILDTRSKASRALRRDRRTGVPSQQGRGTLPRARPTRLADGLGLESAPIRRADLRPWTNGVVLWVPRS